MKAELTSENSVRRAIDFDIEKEVVTREIDKRAKDIASAAVLTASAGAAVVGVLVFVARCVELWLELS